MSSAAVDYTMTNAVDSMMVMGPKTPPTILEHSDWIPLLVERDDGTFQEFMPMTPTSLGGDESPMTPPPGYEMLSSVRNMIPQTPASPKTPPGPVQ